MELRDDGDYYSIVSVFNGSPRGKLVWSGRSLRLSTLGSGDMTEAMTATTGQSESPSARTDQSRNDTPKRPLETLADQASGETVALNGGKIKPMESRATRQQALPNTGATPPRRRRGRLRWDCKAAHPETMPHGTLCPKQSWMTLFARCKIAFCRLLGYIDIAILSACCLCPGDIGGGMKRGIRTNSLHSMKGGYLGECRHAP